MAIGEICNRDVVIAGPKSTVTDVAKLMREHHVGDVVIVEDAAGLTKPVGILTDRDIVLEMIAQEVPLETCTAADIMSFELVTAQEDEGVWDVIQRMRQNGLRRVPVVDGRGGLLGIITADDLLELLADEMTALVGAEAREQQRERRQRPPVY